MCAQVYWAWGLAQAWRGDGTLQMEAAFSPALPPPIPQAPLTPGVTTSKSQVPKTLKKDLKAIEERLARFRMDAVLPGTLECWTARWLREEIERRHMSLTLSSSLSHCPTRCTSHQALERVASTRDEDDDA